LDIGEPGQRRPFRDPVNRSNQSAPKSSIWPSRLALRLYTTGRGDRVGPNLLGVMQAWDRAWFTLKRRTKSVQPATALFTACKEVRMPNLI
jgi:hypothetical protein